MGLGREYTDYTQKIVWYLETLDGVNTSLRIREEDIVVLIDAYDVLLLPAARLIPQIMAQFSTPIVFCSENGIYPEFASPWFYPRGYATDRQFNKFNQVPLMIRCGAMSELSYLMRSGRPEVSEQWVHSWVNEVCSKYAA